MSTVLVTGGTGFLGSRVIVQLLRGDRRGLRDAVSQAGLQDAGDVEHYFPW